MPTTHSNWPRPLCRTQPRHSRRRRAGSSAAFSVNVKATIARGGTLQQRKAKDPGTLCGDGRSAHQYGKAWRLPEQKRNPEWTFQGFLEAGFSALERDGFVNPRCSQIENADIREMATAAPSGWKRLQNNANILITILQYRSWNRRLTEPVKPVLATPEFFAKTIDWRIGTRL